MVGVLVFLTPLGGLVALAAAIPFVAVALAERRTREARTTLGLLPPARIRGLPKTLALLGVPLLLGLAAAQPAFETRQTGQVRTDAQVMFVLDISRSMLAAKGPGPATRLARAKGDAIALRAALSDVPSGIATFTDRVLPSLLPSPSLAAFDATVRQAVAIERPPPADVNVTATDLAALGVLGTGNYFPNGIRKRLAVVLTDGESRPFDDVKLARELASGPGVKLVLVRIWSGGEQVYDGARIEQGYHSDPASAETLGDLAVATGGEAVGEHDLGAAVRAARADLGIGPTKAATSVVRTRPLASFVALIALLLLVALAVVSERATIGSSLTPRRRRPAKKPAGISNSAHRSAEP